MSSKTSSGEIIPISDTLGAIRLEINIADLNKEGALEIIALNNESESLGSYSIQVTNEKGQIELHVNADGENNSIPVVVWVIVGIVFIGGIGTVVYVTLKRHSIL